MGSYSLSSQRCFGLTAVYGLELPVQRFFHMQLHQAAMVALPATNFPVANMPELSDLGIRLQIGRNFTILRLVL